MGLNAHGNFPAPLLPFPTHIVAQYSEPIGTLWSCQALVRVNGDARWLSTMLFSAASDIYQISTDPNPLKKI